MHRRFVANAQAFRLSCYGTAAWTEGVAAVPKNRRLDKANNLRPEATRGTFAALRCLFLLPTRKQ